MVRPRSLIKSLVSFAFMVMCFFNVEAQDIVRVVFEDEPIILDSNRSGISQVYKVTSDRLVYRDTSGEMRLPKSIDTSQLAYCFEYFTGCENSYFDRVISVLVENYRSSEPTFWIDQNGNLDFTDDERPRQASDNGSCILTFRNSENPEATFSVRYFRPERDSATKAMWQMYLGKPGWKNEQYLEEVDYWFSTQRLNTRVVTSEINDTTLRIGVHDYDCDGRITRNGKDRVLINYQPDKTMTTRVLDGACILEDTTLTMLGNRVYQIAEVEEAGKYVEFRESNLAYEPPIIIGSQVPDFKVKVEDGEMAISKFFGDKDYLFIDIWGAWCKGCVSQVGDVIDFEERFADSVATLGLNYGDSEQSRQAFIDKYNLTWVNAQLSREIIEKLNIEGYPTYLLLDKNLQLLSYESAVYRVEQYFLKEED